MSVCQVCLSHAGIVSKCLNGSSSFLAQRLSSAYHMLCYEGFWVSPKIREVLPSESLSQTLDSEKFRQVTSIVTSVVQSVWLTTVASSSLGESSIVYNTVLCIVRVRPWELRLVKRLSLSNNITTKAAVTPTTCSYTSSWKICYFFDSLWQWLKCLHHTEHILS